MSYDSNDWASPSEPDPFGADPFSAFNGGGERAGGRPTRRPEGSDMPIERIQIERTNQPMALLDGVFSQAWGFVQQYPGQTILMSILMLMFGGGGCNGNIPDMSDFNDSSSGGWESHESSGGYDYASPIDGHSFLGHRGLEGVGEVPAVEGGGALDTLVNVVPGGDTVAGAIGAGEMAIIFVLLGIILVAIIFAVLINTAVVAASQTLWMRIVRRQDSSLGAAFKIGHCYVKLLFTNALLWLLGMFMGGLAVAPMIFFVVLQQNFSAGSVAVSLGMLLLVMVPFAYVMLGLYFTSYMVIDKNIPYLDAMRASWQLTEGHRLSLLGFIILAWLLNVVGVLMCCVGVVATNAVVMGAQAIMYDRLAAPGNAYLGEHEDVSSVFS